MLPIAILAGGLATRLRPLTENIPKSMIKILGQPFVHWQMKLLAQEGVTEIVFCLAYKSQMIQDFIGDGSQYGVKVQYSYDGVRQIGTGGAISKAISFLGEKFMVLYGDSYLPTKLSLIESSFYNSGKPALMTVFFNENKFETSNVVFREGQIERYAKGEISEDLKYVDYGLSCFKSSVFLPTASDKPLDLGQICSALAEMNLLAGHEVKERFYEIGSFQGISDFEEYLGRNRDDL